MEATMHPDPAYQREGSSPKTDMKRRRRRGRHAAILLRRALRQIASACRGAMNRIGTELSSRRHERFLASLDDRTLADIGIMRHEIPVRVRSVGGRRGRTDR